MAEEKHQDAEETKWWIDRGPVKEREKPQLHESLIEKWAYELLKDYHQEEALQNVADINERVLRELPSASGEWGYLSHGVGEYPPEKLSRIKESLNLPRYARGLIVDAGYSVRVLVTGEPVGERVVDINFTEAPSVDYWVKGELAWERLFPTVNQALKQLRFSLRSYLEQQQAS